MSGERVGNGLCGEYRPLELVVLMIGKRSPISTRCYRAESWIRKANALPQSDTDGRFVFYWIAFNALYGQPKYLPGSDSDEESDIKKFFAAIIPLDRRNLIRSELDGLKFDVDELTNDIFLNKRCWVEWHQRELETARERIKYPFFAGKRDFGLTGMFKSLYVLRNQLFHGCSADRGSKNRDALKRAVKVLGILVPIFKEIVNEQENDGRLNALLGELPYPPSTDGIG